MLISPLAFLRLRVACVVMPAVLRFALRPLRLTSLVALSQGLPQARRSAASCLMAATSLVVPRMALTLAVPLLGLPALAASPAAWAAYNAKVRATAGPPPPWWGRWSAVIGWTCLVQP